jgi:phosphoribosyl-AMP cyclohydrolase
MADSESDVPTSHGLDRVDFEKGAGLVPVIVQDSSSLDVLMLGYANREAVQKTLETGNLHFWSRSRSELWLKGEHSGNYLRVSSLAVDCDGDTLLALVRPATGTTAICHTGAETCFFQELDVSTSSEG